MAARSQPPMTGSMSRADVDLYATGFGIITTIRSLMRIDRNTFADMLGNMAACGRPVAMQCRCTSSIEFRQLLTPCAAYIDDAHFAAAFTASFVATFAITLADASLQRDAAE